MELLRQMIGAASGVNILINNAVARPMGDWSSPVAQFAKSMEVNATGLLPSPAPLASTWPSGDGAASSTSARSRAWWAPISRFTKTSIGAPPDYFFHKGGLVQLTRYAAAKLWAPRRAVNAIVPGGFFNHQDPRFVARYNARTFLGRMANETDVKGAIVFLASDASAYVTGGCSPSTAATPPSDPTT